MATAIPEPSSLALAAFGVGLVVTFARRECTRPQAHRVLVATNIVLLVSAGSARAASFNVSNVAELVSAINAANQNAVVDTISLSPGTTFTLIEANNTLHGSTGLPAITDSANLTIFGNGSVIERSPASGTSAFRLCDVAAGATLSLANVTWPGVPARNMEPSFRKWMSTVKNLTGQAAFAAK